MPQAITDQVMASMQNSGNGSPENPPAEDPNKDAWDRYNQQTREYGDRQMKVQEIQYLFSPTKNYEKITTCLTSPTWTRYLIYFTHHEGQVQKIDEAGNELSVDVSYTPDINFDFSGILSLVIGNIIALCVLPTVFFGLAYVRFMRMDIR
jgi:ABC-2 type transport system permease protein